MMQHVCMVLLLVAGGRCYALAALARPVCVSSAFRSAERQYGYRYVAPKLSADPSTTELPPSALTALDEVSQCLKQCGNTTTVYGSKRSFYQAVYTPGKEKGTWKDPTPGDWDAIRVEWPELAEYDDEMLKSDLPRLRANQLDFRSLKFLDLNLMGPHAARAK